MYKHTSDSFLTSLLQFFRDWLVKKQDLIEEKGFLRGDGSSNMKGYTTIPVLYGGTGASTAAAALAALQAQKELSGVTVTLSASGWTDKTQTVSVTGVTASNVVFVGAGEDKDNQTAYAKAGITCTGQAAGTLTFTCDTVPTADITANVVPC